MNIDLLMPMTAPPAAAPPASAAASSHAADPAQSTAPVFSLDLPADTSTDAILVPAAAPGAGESGLAHATLKAPALKTPAAQTPQNPAENLLALLARLERGSAGAPVAVPSLESAEAPPDLDTALAADTAAAANATPVAATPPPGLAVAMAAIAAQAAPERAPSTVAGAVSDVLSGRASGTATPLPDTAQAASTAVPGELPAFKAALEAATDPAAATPALELPPASLAADAGAAERAAPEFKLELPALPPTASAARPGEAPPTAASAGTLPAADTPEAFSEQVIWHLGRGLQEARIHLHPQELGAVEIQLQLKDERASLIFTVEQPQARAAVQAALPQLSLMLSQQGLQLADAQVQSQNRGHSQAQTPPPARQDASNGPEPEAAPSPAVRRRVGLVDQYA